MIRRLAVPTAAVSLCLISVSLGLSGCDRTSTPQAPSPAPDAAQASVADDHPAPAPVDAPPATEAAPAIPGAPAFAALYPGAELDGEPTVASGQAGDGGLVTFRTSASPDAVVEFYRARAESAGLRSVMGMNQGDARAYGAAGNAANGPTLQVVAAPGEGAETSVQLSWSAGQ